ncbi:MAG: DUF309 domain-containing protein [Chloroherpetonaceae bacterium]|nr:DUF309 domain-containing protein [Chloroherpetonaceae bacterium]
MEENQKGNLLVFKDELRRGIEEFNRQDFFEAHDTFEEIWQKVSGYDKLFLHGLLNHTIGFYHFSFGRWKGAVSQFEKGLEKWEFMLGSYKGFQVLSINQLILNEFLPLAKEYEEKQTSIQELKDSNQTFHFPNVSIPQWILEENEEHLIKVNQTQLQSDEELASLWYRISQERVEKEEFQKIVFDLKLKIDLLNEEHIKDVKRKKLWFFSFLLSVFIILMLILKFLL